MRNDILYSVDRFTPELPQNSCINLTLRKELYKNVAYQIRHYREKDKIWNLVERESVSAIQISQLICNAINYKMNRYCVMVASSEEFEYRDGKYILRNNETLDIAYIIDCEGAKERVKTKNATHLVWLLSQLGMYSSIKNSTDYPPTGNCVCVYGKHIKEVEFIDSILGASQDMGCKYLLSDVSRYLDTIGPLDDDEKKALKAVMDSRYSIDNGIFRKYGPKEGGKAILVKNSERVGLQIDSTHYDEIYAEIKRLCPLEDEKKKE